MRSDSQACEHVCYLGVGLTQRTNTFLSTVFVLSYSMWRLLSMNAQVRKVSFYQQAPSSNGAQWGGGAVRQRPSSEPLPDPFSDLKVRPSGRIFTICTVCTIHEFKQCSLDSMLVEGATSTRAYLGSRIDR